ncbi:hypothetical protein THAOC_20017, partial [Thalassiosira oceanica]
TTGSTTVHRVLSCTPVLDARLPRLSAPHIALFRFRVRRYLASYASDPRDRNPALPVRSETHRPQPDGAGTLPRHPTQPPARPPPLRDPVLAQPMSFTSSDVAVFLSARRDEASANDTPGSQIAQLSHYAIERTAAECLRLRRPRASPPVDAARPGLADRALKRRQTPSGS